MGTRFYSYRSIWECYTWSQSTVRRMVKDGVLSPPVSIGPNRKGFPGERFEAEAARYIRKLNAEKATAAA